VLRAIREILPAIVVNSYINTIQGDNKKGTEEYIGTEDKVQFLENYEDIKKNMADEYNK
jgi:hypothetical protein